MNDFKLSSISITSGTIFRTFLIGILFFLIYFLRDLVISLLTAVVIASSMEPVTNFLKKFGIPRLLSVIIVFLSAIIFILGIAYLFVPPLLSDIGQLSQSLHSILSEISLFFDNKVSEFGGGVGIANDFSKNISAEVVISSLKDFFFGASSSIFGTIQTLFDWVAKSIIILVVSFYLSVQEGGIKGFLRVVTPDRHEKYVLDLWRRSQVKIGLWMQGQMVLGILIGVLVYLGLTLFGVRYALLLALISAICELIPLFGPIMAMTPGIMLAFVDGGASVGFLVAGYYIAIQQFESHLIYPLVVRKVIGVPPLLVIISLIVGAKLAGFLGLVIAVPVAAAIVEFLDDLDKNKSTVKV